MLRRELAIVLRARLTWVQASLAALLVGHGYILALDIYSAGSRSALGNRLMVREFDPLIGVVRPTLGGLYLAVSLLAPLAAARPLTVEKERHTLYTLLLQTGSPGRVIATTFTAAALGCALQLVAPVALLGLWMGLGGHLALGETAIAFMGHVLYLLFVAALATGAAAWTKTLAQAASVALVCIIASWAIDASAGFVALAWLGNLLEWSVTTHLTPMERGTLPLGDCLWMTAATIGALAVSWIGLRRDRTPAQRIALGVLAVLATGAVCAAANRVRTAFDYTEFRRASLPAAAVTGLRSLAGPIELDVYLDRDDARRTQLEADVIAKLRLARSDIAVRTPTDAGDSMAAGDRQEGYGRIVVRAGGNERVTYSGSRREIVTLIFEAAAQAVPEWAQSDYPGYPLAVTARQRTIAALVAYAGLPAGLLFTGTWLVRSTRRKG